MNADDQCSQGMGSKLSRQGFLQAIKVWNAMVLGASRYGIEAIKAWALECDVHGMELDTQGSREYTFLGCANYLITK